MAASRKSYKVQLAAIKELKAMGATVVEVSDDAIKAQFMPDLGDSEPSTDSTDNAAVTAAANRLLNNRNRSEPS